MTGKKNPFFQVYLLQWHPAGSSPGFLSQLERRNAEHHFLHSGNLARLVLLGGRAGLVHPALRVGHDCVVSGRLALRRYAQHREHLRVELQVLGGGGSEIVEQFVAGFQTRRFLMPGPPGARGLTVLASWSAKSAPFAATRMPALEPVSCACPSLVFSAKSTSGFSSSTSHR